jgi:hypothetical protein
MKSYLGCFVFLSLIFFSSSIHAGLKSTEEEKSCEMILCLYGEKTGFGGKVECDPAMAQYKKIMKKSKWGKKILCEQTKELRIAEMQKCKDNEYDIKSLVDCDE